jgi:hypothetical protein
MIGSMESKAVAKARHPKLQLWTPNTSKGIFLKGHSYALYQDTSKRYKSGEPVRSIKWYEGVVILPTATNCVF